MSTTPVPDRAQPPTAAVWMSSVPSTVGIVVGVVSVVVGVVMLAWPSATLVVIAVLFSLQLIVLGAVRIAISRGLPHEPGWLRPLNLVLGILTVVAGVICLFRPGTSIVVIGLLLAVGWIFDGLGAFLQAFVAGGASAGSKVFLVVTGVVLVVAGFVVAVFPRDSLELMIRLSGILLLVVGVVEIVVAVMARRGEQRVLAG